MEQKQESSNGGSSESKKEFTLYSNKSEIQEALTAYAKEWGEKNGVTVNIKTCSGSCKISDQLKTEFTAGTAPDVFVIEGQAGYDMWKDSIQPLKVTGSTKLNSNSNKETTYTDSQYL